MAKTDTVSCNLKVKVVPGASRSCVSGWLGESLKVRVCEPPEKGKANKAVEKVIADALNIPIKSVSIIKGQTSVQKTVQVLGLSISAVKSILQ